jgi:hypothetical protein
MGSWRNVYRLVLGLAAILGSGISNAELIGIDFGPGQLPAGWNAAPSPGTYPNLRSESGQASGITLRIAGRSTPFTVTPNPASLPMAGVDLAGIDGNFYEFGGTFNARLDGLTPGEAYDLYVFGLRSGADLRQQVTLAGADRVAFVQAASDGLLAVNDGVGARDRQLGAYAKRVTASAGGSIDITVVGDGPQGRPFVLAGLALAAAETQQPAAAQPVAAIATSPAPAPTAAPSAPAAPAAPPAQAAPAGPAASVDIAGIHLGMTRAQVKSALQAFDPRLRIQEFPAEVTITDASLGVKLSVGRYVREVEAGLGHGVAGYRPAEDAAEKFVVRFSPPPNEDRIEQIAREIQYVPRQGPGYDALLESLQAKYGPATYVKDNGPSLIQMWQYSGPRLTETQFLAWSAKRNRAVTNNLHSVKGAFYPLTADPIPVMRDGGDGYLYPEGGQSAGALGAPYVGENLGAYVTRQGFSAYIFRMILTQDPLEVDRKRRETWQMSKAALEREVGKLQDATNQRNVPRL